MKVLMHMLVDVAGAQHFGAAARSAAKLAKSTGKVAIDAISIEPAKVVSPDILTMIVDVVSEEVGIPIKDDQAKRIATALDFGTELDEMKFYDIYPEDEDL
jgi:hypothetical protein